MKKDCSGWECPKDQGQLAVEAPAVFLMAPAGDRIAVAHADGNLGQFALREKA